MTSMAIVLLLALIAAGGVAALAFFVLEHTGEPSTAPRVSPALAPGGTPVTGRADLRQRHWFEGTRGGSTGKTYHIGAREFTLGRTDGNYVQLTEHNVSRVHARVRSNGDVVVLQDEGTANGTWVNGQKMSSRDVHVLADGDRVRIGPNELVYRAHATHQTNHGIEETKLASASTNLATVAPGSIDLGERVQAAWITSGKDTRRAAEIMGVTEEVFTHMMHMIPK